MSINFKTVLFHDEESLYFEEPKSELPLGSPSPQIVFFNSALIAYCPSKISELYKMSYKKPGVTNKDTVHYKETRMATNSGY